jgi:type I restriction enzyme R subunit
VVEGEIEKGKAYEEADINCSIEIREREKKRVQIFLSQINPNEKTLGFCANQAHALVIRRDLLGAAQCYPPFFPKPAASNNRRAPSGAGS